MENYKKVMVVEDDLTIRDILSEVLILEGYKVVTASNGQEALDLLQKIEKPGLIFLDLMMPIMNGQMFLEILKKDQALASIPVIVTSADPDIFYIEGAHSILRKPFNLDLIFNHAKKFCE